MRASPSPSIPTVLFPSPEFYRGTVAPHALSPNWLTALSYQLNPHNYLPPQKVLETRISQWRSALRTFLLADLRAGHYGKRVHKWDGTGCVIAYYLHPMPVFLDALGLYAVRDCDIDEEVLQMIDGFALCPTWIYSPTVSRSPSPRFSFSWFGCIPFRHKYNRSYESPYKFKVVSLSSLPSHSSQDSFFLPISSHTSPLSSASSILSGSNASSRIRQPTGIPMDSGSHITLDGEQSVEEEQGVTEKPFDKELHSWGWRSERVVVRLGPSADDDTVSRTKRDNASSQHEVVASGSVP